MIKIQEAKININQAFGCQRCKVLVNQPFVNKCCQLIICQNCIQVNPSCLICSNQSIYTKSNLLQQMFKCVYLYCPFDCKAHLSYFQLQKHKLICPEATTDCQFCKKKPKIRLIPQHLGEDHIEQCNRMLNEFQKQKEARKVAVVNEISIIPNIKPFKHGSTGQINIDPRISKVGRIVCGRNLPQVQLPGQRLMANSFFAPKNKEICSVQHGSCDRCMELDVDRLGLPKFYLLNLQGRICCYLIQRRKVACGCMNGKVCNEQSQCAPCRKTLDLIERGFYKKCF